jgi:hypothetical protein
LTTPRLPAPPAAALAAALALALASPSALAQEAPPRPPPDAALLALSAEAPPDDVLNQAVQLLRTRQTEQAVVLLGRLAQERAVDVRGYDPVAVLFRLANGRARPGLPTAGALPPAAAPAPPVAGGDDLPPPPPSDEVARARIIDGAVERLARWDEAGARGFLDGAVGAATDRSLEALRAVAQGGVPVAPVVPAMAVFGASGRLLPERPAGTIEGFEVLTLYVSTASYGLMLGTWGGLAVTDDRRNALRIALPLAGLSAGLVGAIVLDRSRAVRRGRGYAFNSGLVLGSLAGTAAVIYAQPDDAADGWGLALGGATLGIGAALGLAHAVDALPGSVSWVTSAGLWGSMIGLGLSLTGDGDDARPETIASGMLIGEGVGVVLALLTADALKPTPGQTRWVDVGASLGGMLGASLGTASDSVPGIGVGMAIGVLAGGALAWFAASPSEADRSAYMQHNAARDLPLRFGVAPLRGGAMLQVGM